jgi:hypothetical protein
MRALSIRQPFAELILRGIKTVEYRTRPTRIIGERFHIYAAKKPSAFSDQLAARKIWSRDVGMAHDELPDWMIELAEQIKLIPADLLLPRGVIVGSAVIEKCVPLSSLNPEHRTLNPLFQWHLADVRRATRFRKPRGHPQPVWFTPF